MYIYLFIKKPFIDREIYVEYDCTEGGDGWNEPRWRELRIEKVYSIYYKSGVTFHDKELNDIIQRASDIYNIDLWGRISELITDKLD